MKKILFTLSFAYLLFACQKEESPKVSAIKNSDSRFTIENNYVRFKDVASFNSVMTDLNKLKTSELSKWEKENGISNSLRAAETDTINSVEPEDMLVVDLRFAAIINKDGLFAIGDSMHLITSDKEYVYKIGTKVSLGNLKSGSSDVRVFNIVKQKLGNSKLKSFANQTHYYDQWSFDLPPSDAVGTRRVRCYVWSTSYVAYCSNGIGLYSEFRTKNWLGQKYWKDSRCQYMDLSGCSLYAINGVDQQSCDSDYDTNEYNEQCTIGSGVGTIYTGWIIGYFRFKLNSGYPEYYTDGVWY